MKTLALAACLAFGANAAAAFDLTAMTEDERAAFRDEVRAYLLNNPEVLMEAMEVLEARQRAAQTAGDADLVKMNIDALTGDDYSWVGGNPDGDITIVEFLDYRCGFCKRAHPVISELVETDGNIRLIVKEFPILGPASELASRFAIATKTVAGDEAYKDIHDRLMELRADVSERALKTLARHATLDFDAIEAEMYTDATDAVIAKNRELAQTMRITGTPTFVVGGQMLRGYMPVDGMRDMVAEERAGG